MAKYCGLKSANELAGRRVKLTRTVSNGLGEMPAGTEGVVDCTSVRNGHIKFKADKCKCCEFQWRVGSLSYDDLEIINAPHIPREYDYKIGRIEFLISGDGRFVQFNSSEISHYGDIQRQVFETNLWKDKYQTEIPDDVEEYVAEGTAAWAIRFDNNLLSEMDWDWCKAVCDAGNAFTVNLLWDLVIGLKWKLQHPVDENDTGWQWLKERYADDDPNGTLLIAKRVLKMAPLR